MVFLYFIREGIIRSNGVLKVDPGSSKREQGRINEDFLYYKKDFVFKLNEMRVYSDVKPILDNLLDTFTIGELRERARRFVGRRKHDRLIFGGKMDVND